MRETQAKSAGKPGEMPADDQVIFDNAAAEFDRLSKQIENEQKVESAERFTKALAPISDALDLSGGAAKKGERTIKTVFNDFLKSASDPSAMVSLRAEMKALTAGNPSAAGLHVIPIEIAKDVITLLNDECWVRGQATVLPQLLTAETLGVISFNDLSDFDWLSENASAEEDTSDTSERRDLQPRRGSKLIKISRELARKAPDITGFVMDQAAFVMSRTQEKAFLTGTGVGRPLGFLTNNSQGVSTGRRVQTASAGVVAFDDVINTLALLKSQYREDAFWCLHRNMEARLRKVKDSNNYYVWQPGAYNGNQLSGPMPATILGFPYRLTEFMTDPSATGSITAGTKVMSLQNLKRGYYIVDALDMEMVPMEQVFAQTNYLAWTLNFYTDGMPVDENAFANLEAS